jgi:hypothetical protein
MSEEYPKTLYREGTGQGHMLEGKPLKIDNKYLCDVLIVADEDGELAALADGWHPTPAEACAPEASPKKEAA